MRELAGPAAFISVIMTWAVLIAVGWALIYWPFLPDSFLVDFGADLDRDSAGNFVAALYLSIIVMSTLGFGDIVPTEGWLRIIIGIEALLGFGLLTTGISAVSGVRDRISTFVNVLGTARCRSARYAMAGNVWRRLSYFVFATRPTIRTSGPSGCPFAPSI